MTYFDGSFFSQDFFRLFYPALIEVLIRVPCRYCDNRADYFIHAVSVSFSFLQKSPKNSCDSHSNEDATDLCIDPAPFSNHYHVGKYGSELSE